jgi:signal transduction histidine kinase
MRNPPTVLCGAGETLVGAISLLGLYAVSRYSYVAFHTLAELFSIVIGFSLFMLIWNARRFIDNNYLAFLGIAYLFVAGMDLVHTLAYKGMDIFIGYGTNLPTQLWISARYLESLTLLIAPLFIQRKLATGWALVGYGALTAALLVSIFTGIFPDCYIEGVGLTRFKVASEYIISAILLCALLLLLKKRNEFDRDVLSLLVLSIILTIGSELFFTFYIGVYDISNLVGHLLKIVSFYLIYKAVIEKGLTEPYRLLFRNLKQAELELQKRTALLEDANKELESFTYSVSHDLRAPPRAIEGFSRVIMRKEADHFDEETRRQFNLIGDNTRAMGQLIEDLLRFSRASRKDLEKTDINIRQLIEVSWEELREVQVDRRMTLTIGELPPAWGDRNLIKQVIVNLLSNAVKFTRAREDARIEAGAYAKDGEWVYFIRDNGAGFDMKYYDKLFGVFQRLHTASEFEGTGIGLALVQRIIKRHGGRVWAEADVNRGATFYFTLQSTGGKEE